MERIIELRNGWSMKKEPIRKVIVFIVMLLFILVTLIPSYNSLSDLAGNNIVMQDIKELSANRDWTLIEGYPNYAPKGIPDFDQKQKQWKSIVDGGNEIVETNATGDDIQLISWGSEVGLGDIIVAPGENCQLDTITSGDDVEKWTFSGPVSLANSLWWFDSKFSDPDGIPGDGEDNFPLVETYADDDHSPENVPLLIENLARYINTSDKGTSSIEDMKDAVDLWLINSNLEDRFESTILEEPTFDLISDEISDNQNVILQLGYYEFEIGEKLVDQSQSSRTFNKFMQTENWWDYQSFTPTVNRIDGIRIPLHSTSAQSCAVEINVYDTEGGESLGNSIFNPGILDDPAWIQFPFEPSIELNANNTYFFDVRQLDGGYHYQWFYTSPGVYDQGIGWMDQLPYDPYGIQFDWTFETLYYDPPPGSVRKDTHFVTCSGIDYENSMIAFSDPYVDVNNTNDLNHNDAKNISHDTYLVEDNYPYSDLDLSMVLPDYPITYNYTLVVSAIVIRPIPDNVPPEVNIIKPVNSIYFLDEEIYPFILPVAIGILTIEVDVTDNREVDSVKFIVNGILKSTDTSKPYKWKWEEGAFFIQTIEVEAVDTAGNHGYDILTLLKFF